MRFSRRQFLASIAFGAILATSRAQAWVHGNYPAPTGRTVVNGFADTVGNGNSYAFRNLALMTATWSSSGGYAWPSVMNEYGLPSSSPATDISGVFQMPGFPTSGRFVLKWTGTGAVRLSPSQSPNGFTVSSGGQFVVGSTAFTMTVRGANARVVFSYSGTTVNNTQLIWPSGETFTGMANFVICREEDEAGLDAGDPWNPDFINVMRVLNPNTLRLMDWCRVNNSVPTQFEHRWQAGSLSYIANKYVPARWAGTIGGTNAYNCSAPSGWAGIVDGALVQGQVTNAVSTIAISAAANNGSGLIRLTVASTAALTTGNRVAVTDGSGNTVPWNGPWTVTVIDGTHLDLQGSTYTATFAGTLTYATLDVGSSGAKLIVSIDGWRPSIAAAALGTFAYSAIFDAYIFTASGAAVGVPIEMQVSLANKLGVNLWTCLPDLWTQASIEGCATVAKNYLNGVLVAQFEMSNELWNGVFDQSARVQTAGRIAGFPSSSGRDLYGYTGLLVRRAMGYVTSIWNGATAPALRRTMAFQAYGAPSSNQTYQFNGTDLGSYGFNSFPNRPIDYCDVMSYATYYQGAQLTGGPYSSAVGLNTGGPSGTGLLGAADDFASGVPAQMAAALSFLDFDFRQGTKNSVLGSQTLLSLNSSKDIGSGAIGIYPSWEASAAGYDSQRTGGGLATLKVACYEGGLQAIAPTSAQCTTMGINTTYATTIATLLTAYKNDTLQYALTKDQYTQFRSQSHSLLPAWFQVMGFSQWSMMPASGYTTPYFQSYYGTQSYNT